MRRRRHPPREDGRKKDARRATLEKTIARFALKTLFSSKKKKKGYAGGASGVDRGCEERRDDSPERLAAPT